MIRFVLFAILLLSCSKEESFSKLDMYKLGVDVEPKLEVLMPSHPDGNCPEDHPACVLGIKCEDYGPGCVAGFSAKVRLVTLILVEFDSEESAMAEAKKLNQYYAKNWLFDDVTNEPVLEDFVKKAYGATR